MTPKVDKVRCLTKTIIMNKKLFLIGNAVVVISKAMVLKSVLIDLSAYQNV